MNLARVWGCAALFVAVTGVAQPSHIDLSFIRPAPGVTVDASVSVSVSVTSTYELQFVRAALASLQTNLIFQNGVWTNTFNVSAINEAHQISGRPITKFIADNLAAVINAREFQVPVANLESIAA